MVLQFITQALREVEELKKRISRSIDILTDNEALIARLNLQKICQQILILDLEYAINQKIEQDLWNLGFKNYIDILQKLVKDKKNTKRSEHQGLLNICLESASGFYLVLLEEICVAFSVSLPFPSYRKHSYLQLNTAKSLNLEHLIKQPQKSSSYYICQHCLVHLGDIARYKLRCKQAEIFYRNAIILSPFSGQPYNQLALLETSRGDKLATVFYYIRSVAVRNPFPAAISNLTLTLNKANNINGGEWSWTTENNKSSSVLSANEFIALFLKVHAVLHLTTDVLPCTTYVRLLSTSLTAHVATESFTSVTLLQMMVINMYAYYNVNVNVEAPGGSTLVDDIHLTGDERLAKTLLTELIAGSLNAFLLPIYTYKREDSLLQYFALPAIKITLDWIRINSHVLEEAGFLNRPQIWPAFCKLINELEPLLKSFSHETYKNITLPEDQDLQGFIPLHNAIPEFRYTDNEIDLDSLCKLRAYRIKSFAKWLAHETRFSLIRMCKEDSAISFETTINGSQSSNELIIQQLEELLKNDCKSPLDNNSIAVNAKQNSCKSSSLDTTSTVSAAVVTTEVGAGSSNPLKNKKTGILKSQSFLDKKRDEMMVNDSKKHSRQNVALQTILKRNQEQEHKQVTFKTPSPSLSNCSDNQDSTVNQSQLWPSNISMTLHLPQQEQQQQQQQQQQQSAHSMFLSSFSGFPDPFRTLPPPPPPPPQPLASTAINFSNKNSPFFAGQSVSGHDIQRSFPSAPTPLYQNPPFHAGANDRMMNPFFTNTVNENKNPNIMESSRLTASDRQQHIQRNQYANQTNLNFLPPWKQESGLWWTTEDKQKVANANNLTTNPPPPLPMLEESSNSFFHYRSPVVHQSSPSSNTPFRGGSAGVGGSSGHLQYPPQPLQTHPLRQIQQPQPQLQSQSQQQQQQHISHLRTQNSSNVANMPVGLWSNAAAATAAYKASPQPQNTMNSASLYNSNLSNKAFFDPLSSFNQNNVLAGLETAEKNNVSQQQHTQLPNNTYSLFNPMWSNTSPRSEDNLNQNQSTNNPLAILTQQQSIWSEGVSPLQRLLEQQKQMRDGASTGYHQQHHSSQTSDG